MYTNIVLCFVLIASCYIDVLTIKRKNMYKTHNKHNNNNNSVDKKKQGHLLITITAVLPSHSKWKWKCLNNLQKKRKRKFLLCCTSKILVVVDWFWLRSKLEVMENMTFFLIFSNCIFQSYYEWIICINQCSFFTLRDLICCYHKMTIFWYLELKITYRC